MEKEHPEDCNCHDCFVKKGIIKPSCGNIYLGYCGFADIGSKKKKGK